MLDDMSRQLEIIYNAVRRLSEDKVFENAVDCVLDSLLDYYSADRAYIFEFDEGITEASNTFERCAKNIKPQIEMLQHIPSNIMTFWVNIFKRNESIHLGCIDDITSDRIEERKMLKMQGIEELIAVPFYYCEKLRGFIGVDNLKNNKNNSSFMSTIGHILSSDIIKHRNIRSLEENAKRFNELLDMSNSKTEFLSRMSHEIRTPLNAIIGYNCIAAKYVEELTNENKNIKDTIRDCIVKSEIAGGHLMNVINDVLDMSSIEKGKLSYVNKNFSVLRLINSLEQIFTSSCSDKNINFIVDLDMDNVDFVVGDSLRINQILYNILGNAVKFTPANGTVYFDCNVVKRHDNIADIRFIIRDTGIGMSEEYLSRIWVPFEQESDSISKNYGGSGLGLTLTKDMVDMLDGKISVTSKKQKGTEFVIEIPFELGREIDDEDITDYTCIKFNNINVLVAEDNEMNAEIMYKILSSAGINVTLARDGHEAIDKYKNCANRYDIIFMDVKMPGISGYEATRIIRELDKEDAKTIPIIAMTADAFVDDVKASKSAGMNNHIAKPIYNNRLFKIINDIVNK